MAIGVHEAQKKEFYVLAIPSAAVSNCGDGDDKGATPAAEEA